MLLLRGNSAIVFQAQTYTLTQTATAGGRLSNGAGGTYNLSSTSGQIAALNSIGATPVSMTVGFWSPDSFAPTAANVRLGGRITTADGAGIRNIRLMLVGGQLSAPRYAQTGTFGYFRFENLQVGETYVLTV